MKKKNGNASGKHRVRILFPVGARFVLSFTLVLFAVLIIINSLSTSMFARNLERIAGENNFTVNSVFAMETENRFNSIRRDAHLLLDFILIAGKDSFQARQASTIFFERSHFIAAVCVPGFIELVDDYFFIASNINPGSVSSWLSREDSRILAAKGGEPVISNPSVELGISLIAMFYPWQQNEREEAVVILFSPDVFAEIFGAAGNSSFVVNADADVLFHFDSSMVSDSLNVSRHPLFSAFANTDDREIETIYTENGQKYFGAGKKLSLANIMVLSVTEYEKPFGIVSAISRSNMFLIVAIIFISIVLIWLLSKTITEPIKRLVEAMSHLEEGKFDTELKYNFPDEIGLLSEKFNSMGKFLIEKIPAKQEKTHKKSRK